MTADYKGKACVSPMQWYNVATGRMELKARPVLIISEADSTDYVALPISRVLHSQHIHPTYDYPLEVADYPLMKLSRKSYVRAHKQFIVNKAEIKKIICDFRASYPEAYSAIVELVKRFQRNALNNAL